MATKKLVNAFTPAKVVKISQHGGESWLEKQIKADPTLLGLEGVRVTNTQVIHKSAGRLDLLAKDEEGQVVYCIEIMLGKLDASHLTRSIDYWLREKSKVKDDWETVAVVAAEEVRDTRYYHVAQFLSERMPLIVIEMKAHSVGAQLTLIPIPLLDGTASIDSPSVEQKQAETMTEQTWHEKASHSSVQAVVDCGKILKKIGRSISLNWSNQDFVGIIVDNRPRNFLVFKPKRNWVRIHARFLPDSEKWRKKLAKAGLTIVGGKPGRSVHFRLAKIQVKENSALLQALFTDCYKNRLGGKHT